METPTKTAFVIKRKKNTASKKRRRSKASPSIIATKQPRIARLQDTPKGKKRTKKMFSEGNEESVAERLGLAASRGNLLEVKSILSKSPELINEHTNTDAYTSLHRACKVLFLCQLLLFLFLR